MEISGGSSGTYLGGRPVSLKVDDAPVFLSSSEVSPEEDECHSEEAALWRRKNARRQRRRGSFLLRKSAENASAFYNVGSPQSDRGFDLIGMENDDTRPRSFDGFPLRRRLPSSPLAKHRQLPDVVDLTQSTPAAVYAVRDRGWSLSSEVPSDAHEHSQAAAQHHTTVLYVGPGDGLEASRNGDDRGSDGSTHGSQTLSKRTELRMFSDQFMEGLMGGDLESSFTRDSCESNRTEVALPMPMKMNPKPHVSEGPILKEECEGLPETLQGSAHNNYSRPSSSATLRRAASGSSEVVSGTTRSIPALPTLERTSSGKGRGVDKSFLRGEQRKRIAPLFALVEGVARMAGAEDEEDDGDLLTKKIVAFFLLGVLFASAIWGSLYYATGVVYVAIIPYVVTGLMALSAIHFMKSRNIEPARTMTILCLWIAPQAVHVALGGMEHASNVIRWIMPVVVAAHFAYRPWTTPSKTLAVASLAMLLFWAFVDPYVARVSIGKPTETFTRWMMLANEVGPLLMGGVGGMYFMLNANSLEERNKNLLALMLNIFPRDIAERLYREGFEHDIADEAPQGSLLFADIVGFTSVASTMTPKELVSSLSAFFSEVDELCLTFGVEKIKTIGDAIMVATGLKVDSDPRDAARRIVAFGIALSRLSVLLTFGRKPLVMRIGVASGPVVSGIIGETKIAFDVWGDTVNVASRLESSGVPGRVHISESTRNLLSDSEFDCIPRGEVLLKGKGKMRTFLVNMAGDSDTEPSRTSKPGQQSPTVPPGVFESVMDSSASGSPAP